jgi:predicted NBD/HSP70 family sugar kinase
MRSWNAKPELLKKINKDLVMEIVANKAPISKPQIAAMTKLSLTTVNKTLNELKDQGMVLLSGMGDSKGGRKPDLYTINPDSGYVCGILLSGSMMLGALSNITGQTITRRKTELTLSDRELIVSEICNFIELLSTDNKGIKPLKAIGIGVPGVVNNDGLIYNISTIPQLENYNLGEVIFKRTGISVFTENDVNLCSVGSHQFEYKRKYANLAYLVLGPGAGMGIIIDNKLYKGSRFFAGEIGFMALQTNNPVKRLPANRGQFEERMRAFVRAVQEQNDKAEISETLRKFVENEENLKAYEHFMDELFCLVINIICILDPDVIVIGGDLACDEIIGCVRSKVSDYLGEENSGVIQQESSEFMGLTGCIFNSLEKVNPGIINSLNLDSILSGS